MSTRSSSWWTKTWDILQRWAGVWNPLDQVISKKDLPLVGVYLYKPHQMLDRFVPEDWATWNNVVTEHDVKVQRHLWLRWRSDPTRQGWTWREAHRFFKEHGDPKFESDLTSEKRLKEFLKFFKVGAPGLERGPEASKNDWMSAESMIDQVQACRWEMEEQAKEEAERLEKAWNQPTLNPSFARRNDLQVLAADPHAPHSPDATSDFRGQEGWEEKQERPLPLAPSSPGKKNRF